MGFLDALFGRPRLKAPDVERLFALPAAGTTLQAEAGLQPAGRAGVCLKAVDSGEFEAAEAELRDLVGLAARDFKGDVQIRDDEYGYRWIVFSDPRLDELVNLVHMVATTLQEKGFGEQLLAAVFRFTAAAGRRSAAAGEGPEAGSPGRPFYLIYHYKRGSFYPFAPTGEPESRDEALEFRIGAVLGSEVPIEKDQGRWFPLWDCPV
jgi:hypothetical protein